MTDDSSEQSHQWYCPICDEAIDEAYDHAYEHQDKGPTAADVMDLFQKRPLCPECGDIMDVENWPGTGEYGYPGARCSDCDEYLDTYTLDDMEVIEI